MKKTNYVSVGFFVLGALAILVFSIISFASISFGSEAHPFILYFTDSVSGLSVNSDVKYKGVKIGRVREIPMRYGNAEVPVIIEIDSKYMDETYMEKVIEDPARSREYFATTGLRGSLKLQNFLTGILYVDLDFYEGKAARWHEAGKYLEIPTIPSAMGEVTASTTKILANLSTVPFGRLAEQTIEISENLNSVLKDLDFKGIGDNLVGAMGSVREILDNPSTRELIDNLGMFSANLNSISRTLDTHLDPTIAEARVTMERFGQTMKKMETLLENLNGDDGSRNAAVGDDVRATLEEINETMRSVRDLAEYLNENPNAIIWGNNEK
ncbi:MAG: MlaD family protein [Opitutales bacterium]|nr:MlaD family protein [Opitutales bacterium]